MSDTTKQPEKSLFKTDLDNEIITLPGRTLRSIQGLFAHLENLALSDEKESTHPTDRSLTSKICPALFKGPAFDEDGIAGTSFRTLGRQVIRTATGQVRVLQTRTQEIQSLVLINSWATAERLWSALLPDCKTPLFGLNFLEELWSISPDQLDVGGWTLTQHWHQFVLIQAQVEIILARRQSMVELSDVLEGQLGLWLKRFSEILERLDEESTT